MLLLAAGCVRIAIKVENARVLPASKGSDAAVYFILENLTFSNDTFLGASSEIAERIEIHRSALIKPEDREAMENGGVYRYEQESEEEEEKGELAAEEINMEMPKLDSMRIKSGYEIEFEPGYYHLMLIGLKRDLAVGDHFTLVLHFAHAGDVSVDVQVVDKIE